MITKAEGGFGLSMFLQLSGAYPYSLDILFLGEKSDSFVAIKALMILQMGLFFMKQENPVLNKRAR